MHQDNASGLWKHRRMKDGFVAAQSSLSFLIPVVRHMRVRASYITSDLPCVSKALLSDPEPGITKTLLS